MLGSLADDEGAPGLAAEESGESVHLSSYLAALKAKYGLSSGLEGEAQQPAAAATLADAVSPSGSPALAAATSPAVARSAASSPPGGGDPSPQPALQSPAAAPAAPQPVSPASDLFGSPAESRAPPTDDGDGDDADFRQLLQLEALEELARRRVQESALEEGALLGAGPGPAGLSPQGSSMPSLSTATSSDWSDVLPFQAQAAAAAAAEPAALEALGAAGDGWGAALPWATLSQQLVQQGFGAIRAADGSGGQPDPSALYATLTSVLAECERHSRHARQLGEAAQAAARREDTLLKRFQAALKEKEIEAEKWKRLALQSQKGLRDAQQAERQSQRAAHKAAADCKQLEERLEQLLHELRAKDAETDRLQQRFASHLDKEDRRAKADKAAYERLKRAFAASKGSATAKAGTAFITSAAREMRPADIVRVYEEERADLQEEVAIIRAENRVLEGQLQRAKESLQRLGGGTAETSSQKEDAQARAMARQIAAGEARVKQLAEENASLQRELAMRPTPDQYASLQRQVDIMARQLSSLAAQKAAANAQTGSDAKPRPKQLPTREAIQRDKALARLGLYTAEQFPKPVLLEIVQDACILLECTDALKLSETIKPVQETAALVPRLQRFVDEVSWTVFQKGLAHVPEQWRQDNPSDIPAILGRWISELGELLETRGTMRALLRQLGSRAGLKPNDPPPATKDVVALVGGLVEFERSALHSREVVAAAEAVLVAQPDVLVNRIVRQFMELFGCKGLEGVLSCMNKLYLSFTEAQTFLGNLRVALGLEAGASLEACTNRVAQLLEHKRELLGATVANAQWRAPPGAAGGGEAQDRGVVVIERPRRSDLQRGAEVAIDRMAAKRNFPTVEIFVPAPRQPLGEQAANLAARHGGNPA